MNWKDRIQIDPNILMGKPVIRGTRLGVGFLLDLLANGWTKEQILESYPAISEDDLKAIFAYSAARFANEEIFFSKG